MAARHLLPIVLLSGAFCVACTGPACAQAVDSVASASDSAAATPTTELTVTDGSNPQFSLRLPRGWTAYDQMKTLTGKSGPFGMVILSSVDPGSLAGEDLIKMMGQWDRGDVPAFFVDRGPAPSGASCAGFSEKAQKKLLKMLASSTEKGDKVAVPFQAEPVTLGGCSGVRVRGQVRTAGGDTWIHDVHALSDGKTMYLFSLRNIKEQFPKNLACYESAMATVKLAGK